MSREYPSHPRVGVAAVVLRDNQVLLVQRGREPGKGSWGLPGGMLELGETLAEGARREVMEECGVEIEVGPLVAVFEPIQRDEDGRLRFHYVVVDYLARYLSGEPRAGMTPTMHAGSIWTRWSDCRCEKKPARSFGKQRIAGRN